MLVVGAGFSGATIARILADAGRTVTVIDKRPHVGGNAYDYYDKHGVLIHAYGPHGFHTNSDRIFNFLSQFTKWRSAELRVLSYVDKKFVPFPINRTTLNLLYNKNMDEEEAKQFLIDASCYSEYAFNAEQQLNATIGTDLTNKFYRGYNKKQWGMELCQIDASVVARIPIRTNDDDRYHTDKHQYVPQYGYTDLFKSMLDHPRIKVELNTPYESKMRHYWTFWTGPIDEFYKHEYGPLPYRSLRFEMTHFPNTEYVQPVAQLNYPDAAVPYTRTVEYKHLTGQKHKGTTVVREYPMAEGDPFYPIPGEANHMLYKKYQERATKEQDVFFVGRLAQYRYYNMDQAVGAAITAAEKLVGDRI